MPTPGERRKKKKFRRTISGKAKVKYFRKSGGKQKCALCKNSLSGTPKNQNKAVVSKLSKTKHRPEAVLGGVLCGKCRRIVFEEAIKAKNGLKKMNEVSLRLRKYVKQVEKKVE